MMMMMMMIDDNIPPGSCQINSSDAMVATAAKTFQSGNQTSDLFISLEGMWWVSLTGSFDKGVAKFRRTFSSNDTASQLPTVILNVVQ